MCEFCGGGHTMMEICPEAPGLVDILRGARGEVWRIGVTIALCLLFVLHLVVIEMLITAPH
jgi:hypothetical protein